ncbi:MAG: MFS transporter [Pirellulales bacterium]|nr:MFS transporter [Pirellulales bacterium]
MAHFNPYVAPQAELSATPWIKLKLGVLMFLELFIWGAWLPLSFSFFDKGGLGFEPWQQELLNIAFPCAAILAMFVANQFVDRNFAAERYLAFSHLIGGLAMLGFGLMAWNHFSGENPPATAPNFWIYFALMAVHCLFYVPTISVANTLAFANLSDPQKEFGPVRLWGTIGWIAASWPFIFILADWVKINQTPTNGMVEYLGTALGTPLKDVALNQGKSWAFIVSGIAALLLAGYSLLLPHTPPKPIVTGEKSQAWLEALKLLKYPFILILFLVTLIDATVHDGFFVYAFTYLEKVGVPSNWIQPAMSVGQIAEILTMAVLGYVLKNLGWKFTMIIGILGHALRFAVFALFPDPYVAVAINLVHGICYAFFFATLYIFVDEYFPKDARASAQGMFNFLILGVGPILSRLIWQRLGGYFTTEVPGAVAGTTEKVIAYNQLLLIPSAAAGVAALMLLFFFHPPAKGSDFQAE